MKSIFEKSVSEELRGRIAQLSASSKAQWGKMNVSQMITHCLIWNRMALEKVKNKQLFIGRLFGKIALRSMIKNDKPMQRNLGTLPELIVSEKSGDVELLKEQWITSMEQLGHLTNDFTFVHSFFGRLNKEQTGLLAYKHTDHHLRQFGV